MNDCPKLWRAATVDDRRVLENQFQVEVGHGHPLKGAHVRLLARRIDQDDALFSVDDGRLAEVHLTWRRKEETDAAWPRTKIFANLDEWLATQDSSENSN